MSRYEIEAYGNGGFMVTDYESDPCKFVGKDGKWRDQPFTFDPFDSEELARDFINEQAAESRGKRMVPDS